MATGLAASLVGGGVVAGVGGMAWAGRLAPAGVSIAAPAGGAWGVEAAVALPADWAGGRIEHDVQACSGGLSVCVSLGLAED